MKDYSEKIRMWNSYAENLRSDIDLKDLATIRMKINL